jgi:2-oxoglutarate dehydrogenase complex dehydrogenase (E1) component-like enzyme
VVFRVVHGRDQTRLNVCPGTVVQRLTRRWCERWEYAGRNPTSSVATGSKSAHKAEIALISRMAFEE